jgi:hypothetical protein
MRRSLAWLVAMPLMLAGSQVAHAVAYRLAFPQSDIRLRALLATGHGYLTWLPLALGAAGAVALVALGTAVLDSARGRDVRELPAVAFALLPPSAFVLQEVLELSLHTGTFGWHALLAPTFAPGLLLQLPFAAIAFLVARLLLRAAERIGRALTRTAPSSARAELVVPLVETLLARLAGAVIGARAPPRAVVI